MQSNKTKGTSTEYQLPVVAFVSWSIWETPLLSYLMPGTVVLEYYNTVVELIIDMLYIYYRYVECTQRWDQSNEIIYTYISILSFFGQKVLSYEPHGTMWRLCLSNFDANQWYQCFLHHLQMLILLDVSLRPRRLVHRVMSVRWFLVGMVLLVLVQ